MREAKRGSKKRAQESLSEARGEAFGFSLCALESSRILSRFAFVALQKLRGRWR